MAHLCAKGAGGRRGMHCDRAPLGLQREVQVENGRKAYARLCANYFGHPAEKLRLVAVTGTNGKTTVSTVIKQVLEQAGYKAGLIELYITR